MKTKTVVERIGERLGDIDWTYDFASHGWSQNCGGHNPKLIQQEVEHLRTLEAAFKAGKSCSVRMYDTYEPVVDAGMYDGWPFWRPVPSFMSSTWLGPSWHAFTFISDIKIDEEPRSEDTRQ